MTLTSKIETHHFADDGTVPNNTLPLVLYRGALGSEGEVDHGWQFAIVLLIVGLLMLVVSQQGLPALGAMGATFAVIGALGILTRLREIGS